MVHSEMCDNWGYDKLHKTIEKHAKDEMHDAEWLIQRILFLEGTPVVSSLNPMKIGKSVMDIVGNNQEAEVAAVHAYNSVIALAREGAAQATADLSTQTLKMEGRHVAWAEIQRSQLNRHLLTLKRGGKP
jgi:bacterioferritin